MREVAIFIAILFVNIAILIYQIGYLSISYNEANIIFNDNSILHYYINFFLTIFGYNDYALRLPMVFIHSLSTIVLYALSKEYLTRASDRLWLMSVYVLLPGISSAALVVNCAGVVIFLVLLFSYLHIYYKNFSYIAVVILSLVNPYFLFLSISTLLYGLYKKDNIYTSVSLIAIAVSLYLYGIDMRGAPEGRFIDTIGLYGAIFSPLIFIMMFYAIYRNMISKELDLLWFISAVVLVSSLLLSFRQKVDIQLFAALFIVALLLSAHRFSHSYHIRLKEHRKKYKIVFVIAIFTIALNAIFVFNSHLLYRYVDKPSRNFAYNMHVAKDLALYLLENNISCARADKESMQLRLKFYGIGECADTVLSHTPSENSKKVTISYNNKPVYITYVTKIHNK